MVGDLRRHLKVAVDQTLRERLTLPSGCVGCGCSLDSHTRGCPRCWDRHNRRHRWADPVYREKQNRARRKRRRRERLFQPGETV